MIIGNDWGAKAIIYHKPLLPVKIRSIAHTGAPAPLLENFIESDYWREILTKRMYGYYRSNGLLRCEFGFSKFPWLFFYTEINKSEEIQYEYFIERVAGKIPAKFILFLAASESGQETTYSMSWINERQRLELMPEM